VRSSNACETDSCAEHNRRVAAFALELGTSLGLNTEELKLLRDAAECHDVPAALLDSRGMARLLADVAGVPAEVAERRLAPVSGELLEVVDAFQRGAASLETRRYVEILEMAEALDQEIEAEPYDVVSHGDDGNVNPYSCAAMRNLQRVSPDELRCVADRLPVFPAAAMRALMKLARPNVELDDLERIAASDPVLAGRVLSTANSARFAAQSEIRTLSQAIGYVGTSVARNVLLSAVIRPLFKSHTMRPVWKHSLECAEVASRIAALTGVVTPPEAFLAGLVHDVGMLAISILNPEATARCRRLVEHGCPQRVTESVVCGTDHAEAGAQILHAWKFPADVCDGVRWHHTPERSSEPQSAILYVTEFWTCSEEDLPSVARLSTAMARIGLTHEKLATVPCSRLLDEEFTAA
jgi:putative nucleotidyltransferase with HDIG domain